jgi:lactoylglutathione lyase
MFKTVGFIMVSVSDMKPAIEFYRDRLGIPLKFESPGWSEFSTGETKLALHGGNAPNTPHSAHKDEHNDHRAGTCGFGFHVDDVEKTYADLRERGVKFVLPPTERTKERIKLAVCVDPDGLEISFVQQL